ncbi:MAG TPA: hypothetical protein VF095_03535 [Bacillota bacterium]
MSILVVNCFDWIGFHLVNELLENGYNVHGLDVLHSMKKEHFWMFFARNDRFTLVKDEQMVDKKKKFDRLFVIDPVGVVPPVQANETIFIGRDENHLSERSKMIVNAPLLFGEWMSMCEEGIYVNSEFIRFHSEKFLTEAIYINDFIKGLLDQVENRSFVPKLNVLSIKCKQKHVKLENVLYIRDNRPIKENIKKVIEHYKRFRHFYK